MWFWSQIADAGGERYLKSYCFGANLSTPTPGFFFADYSEPRDLETFEPCSIGDFAALMSVAYGYAMSGTVTRISEKYKS